MNIFEIFCDGKGRINETNMSSILNFLLDPVRPHGFGHASLARFLTPIKDQLEQFNRCHEGLAWSASATSDMDKWVKRFARIDLTLEEDVFEPQEDTKPRKRILDNVIRFYDAQQHLSLVIAIENKISLASVTDSKQLSEEYGFLRASIDRINRDIPIVFVFLTPEPVSHASQAIFHALVVRPQDIKVNYCWKSATHETAQPQASITWLARALLTAERSGDINPASSHADLFLRSMIKFIANDFQRESVQDEAVSSDNAMSVRPIDEFWDTWRAEKPGTFPLATQLFELIQTTLLQHCEQANLSHVYQLDVRPTTTRLACFYRPLAQDVDVQQKKLPNRPVAIFFEGATSNKRVQLQFERRDGVSLEAFRRGLPDATRLLFDEIQPDESGANYTTLLVPQSTDLVQMGPLLQAAIHEAAQAAIG